MEEGRETERKDNKRNGADRANPEQKSESNEKQARTKEGTPLEAGKWIFPRPPLHISVSKLIETETELA